MVLPFIPKKMFRISSFIISSLACPNGLHTWVLFPPTHGPPGMCGRCYHVRPLVPRPARARRAAPGGAGRLRSATATAARCGARTLSPIVYACVQGDVGRGINQPELSTHMIVFGSCAICVLGPLSTPSPLSKQWLRVWSCDHIIRHLSPSLSTLETILYYA